MGGLDICNGIMDNGHIHPKNAGVTESVAEYLKHSKKTSKKERR
jgi:hypothetical protein